MGLNILTAGVPSLGKILWFQYRKWVFFRATRQKQKHLKHIMKLLVI